MNRIGTTLFLSFLISLFAGAQHDHSHAQHEHEHVGAAEIGYVENKGQWADEVLYEVGFSGAKMFLENDGVVWVRLEDGASTTFHDVSNDPLQNAEDLEFQAHAWKLNFVGGNTSAATVGSDKAAHYINYFLGNDASKWASNVPVFGEVVYNELWSGIDMRWHGEEGNVKYDLMVDAGADLSQIAFAYEGLDVPVRLKDGNLIVTTSVGEFTEMKPVAWYGDDHSPLPCQFVLVDGTVRFIFPDGVDNSRAIVIDPLLMGATYSGVVGNDIYGHCATYDDAGNIYSGGQAFGAGLPASLGAFQATFGGGFSTDIAVNKFSPDASLQIWATYLGGGADDKPHSMIVNAAQEMTVFGSSTGAGYPTTPGALSSAFNGGNSDIVVTRLNVGGTALIGSTYVGGSSDDGRQDFGMVINYGGTFRGEVMVDASNNTFVASCSQSMDFPVSAGAMQGTLGGMQDGVVFGLTPDCSALVWSTFIGGSDHDNALGIRFDAAGDAIVVGGTKSANFPNGGTGWQNSYQGGDKDGYIVKITGGGTMMPNSTFFGTAGEDVVNFIDTDTNGDIWIYGQSDGGVAIQPAGTYGSATGNVFVGKFDQTLGNALITTSLGPVGGFGYALTPVAFLVDVCDHIYISGYNPDQAWSTTPDALYATGGGSDFYLAAYDIDMVGQLFGTYYGGSHVDGGTSRFDKNGVIYQGVCSGGQSMPTSAGAYAPVNNVGWDIGVFKIDFQVAGVNAAGAGTQNTGCAPIAINFLNNSTGNNFLWDFGDGSPLDTAMIPTHTYTTPGAYIVTLIAMDSLSCNLADTIQFPVTIGQASPLVAAMTATPTSNCNLFQVSTTNSSIGTPLAFVWDMGDGSPPLTDTTVVHNYPGPGTYTVTLIAYDPTGCSNPDTTSQQIIIASPLSVDAGFTFTTVPDCNDMIVSTMDTTTTASPTYSWDMGDGTPVITSQNVTNHVYSVAGTYTITFIVTDSTTCNISDTATAQVTVAPPSSIAAGLTLTQTLNCALLDVNLLNTSTGSNLIFNWDMGDGTLFTDTNVVHTYTTPGVFDIQLIVTDAWGCYPADTATAQVTLNALAPVVADMAVDQINSCDLLNVEGLNNSTGDSVSYTWNMGDGTILSTADVLHQYATAGTYTVQLLVTDLTGCNPNDSISVTVTMVGALPVVLTGNDVLCPDGTITLDGTWPGAITYLWNTGDVTPVITIDQPGQYILTVTDSLCHGSDTITVTPAPVHDLFYEYDVCPNAATDVTIPLSSAQSYQWTTGQTTQNITVLGDGTYYYDLVDADGCAHSDSLTLHPIDSAAVMYAPNAFTPDGDGNNDVFRIAGFGEIDVEFDVFDRWGHLIHSANNQGAVWDGSYKGQLVKNGVYVYRLKYTSYCAQQDKREIYGHVTVVR